MWLERMHGVDAIGTGYALSADGLWRQHSWGIRSGELVESTAKRLKYFGRRLIGTDAFAFAEANQEDPDERRWRRLPEVWFRLEKDEDGYPPRDWEGLKCVPVEELGAYKISSVPFFARDVAYEDEILAGDSDESYLSFKAVSKRGGYSTIRLWIHDDEDSNAIQKYFTDRACVIEFNLNFASRLIAIAIPKTTFDQVYAYALSENESSRWEVQDGYIAAGE